MVLNKESFKKLKLAKEEVAIPGLEEEGKLFVHQLTAREMAYYFLAGDKDQEKGVPTLREHLIVRTVHNENGERVFADSDIDLVGEFPQPIVVKLYSVASRLNPMSDTMSEKLEEAVKNSEAPSTDSSTASLSEQDDSTSD